MEGIMTMFKVGDNRSGTHPKVRTAVRFLDREIAIARWCVLAAALTALLVVMVLAHVGG
jgi:hypothetical protein